MSPKRDSSNLSPPVTTTNKRYLFNPQSLIKANPYYLPDHLIVNNSDSKTSSTEVDTETNKQIKIPPIYVHDATNYQEVLKDLRNNTSNEFTTACKGTTLRVNLTSSEDYRKITKFYSENNIKYHTYKNPADHVNQLSVILRNIPISITEDEINTELTKLGYPVIKVARLYNKEKFPIPICAVELTKTNNATEIFNLTRLGYCVIIVEPRRKSRDVPQCRRCQRYGHTKNYCQLEPRCIKCTKNHMYTECPKKENEKPQCVNCGGEHPANYKGCSYYAKISNNTKQSTSQRNNSARTDRTYANTVRNNNNVSINQTDNSSDIITTIIKLVIDLITPHLDKIKPFLTTLIPTLIQYGSK